MNTSISTLRWLYNNSLNCGKNHCGVCRFIGLECLGSVLPENEVRTYTRTVMHPPLNKASNMSLWKVFRTSSSNNSVPPYNTFTLLRERFKNKGWERSIVKMGYGWQQIIRYNRRTRWEGWETKWRWANISRWKKIILITSGGS